MTLQASNLRQVLGRLDTFGPRVDTAALRQVAVETAKLALENSARLDRLEQALRSAGRPPLPGRQ